MTTQSELRAAFWHMHPVLDDQARARRTRSKPQNAQNATTRSAWVDFIDAAEKCKLITAALANRATL